MKPKTVKTIAYILFAVAIAFIVAAVETKRRIYGGGAAFVCIGAGVFENIFYKCPECGKFLGSFSNTCCPHCGWVINESRKNRKKK